MMAKITIETMVTCECPNCRKQVTLDRLPTERKDMIVFYNSKCWNCQVELDLAVSKVHLM